MRSETFFFLKIWISSCFSEGKTELVSSNVLIIHDLMGLSVSVPLLFALLGYELSKDTRIYIYQEDKPFKTTTLSHTTDTLAQVF